MGRKFPPHRLTKRKLGKREPNSWFIAVCEGSNTEPAYLNEFIQDYGNGLVTIDLVYGSGMPMTIVDEAVSRKKRALKTMKKDGFDQLFEVWAIFDIDEHPNIDQAIDKARGNNIKVARSNPCFEIWPVLHLFYQRAHIDRRQLQRLLARLMPNYDKRTGKQIDYPLIKDNYLIARDRAAQQLEQHREVDDAHANPSTNIYKLLDKIIEQGKK